MKEKFADSFAVGIIDKDKTEVDYLKEFDVVTQSHSLILYRHHNAKTHHYIIQINPAMEHFILEGAMSANISLETFGLPQEFEQFKKLSKSVNTKNDYRFKQLFLQMQQAGVADIVRLTNWVEYLRKTNYKSDMAILKKM